jgi:hypothetical protein
MAGASPAISPNDAGRAVRGPLSRLPGEAPPAIGHNAGPPLDPGQSWRAHCWRKARADLTPRLPLEIVKRRVRRAQELGLAYPAYASILLGTGRDIVGFLFTAEAVRLRLEKDARIADAAVAKLAALARCDRLLLAPTPDPEALRDSLAASGARFDAVGPPPETARAAQAALRALLDPRKLPGDAVVMVGARPEERGWAEAARLARFLGADAYFAG